MPSGRKDGSQQHPQRHMQGKMSVTGQWASGHSRKRRAFRTDSSGSGCSSRVGRPLLGLDRNWEDVVGDEKEKLACCLPRMGQNGRECCPSHRYFSWSKKLRSLAGSQVVGSGVCVCLGTPPRGSNDDGGGARGAIAGVILGTTREPEQGLLLPSTSTQRQAGLITSGALVGCSRATMT